MKKLSRRILGIDYGLERIGIALSDASLQIAFPRNALKAGKKLENQVKETLREIERIEKEMECSISDIVIGLPLHMSGEASFLSSEVQLYRDKLALETDRKLHLWDERLTSKQAERSLMEMQTSRKKRSQKVDAVAACLILQNFLDSVRGKTDFFP